MNQGIEKKIIKEFKKRENVSIRVCSVDIMGFPYIEIRQYYKDKEGILQPSHKGINFSCSLIDEMIEALNTAKRTSNK